MTRLYLIRHGENDWVGKRLPGWSRGLHLNKRGRAQAERLAELLAGQRFQAIYSSPLERARETAEPLARRQGLAVQLRPSLRDLNVGQWQGQSLRLLRLRRLWSVIQHTPSRARFPGGESFSEAQGRLVAEVDALLPAHASPKAAIAVVSHADPIKLITAHYLGLPLDLFQRLALEPASISILHLGEGSSRLIRWNDARATDTSGP